MDKARWDRICTHYSSLGALLCNERPSVERLDELRALVNSLHAEYAGAESDAYQQGWSDAFDSAWDLGFARGANLPPDAVALLQPDPGPASAPKIDALKDRAPADEADTPPLAKAVVPSTQTSIH